MHRALFGIALALVAMLTAGMLPAPAMGQDSPGFVDSVSAQIQSTNETDTQPSGEQQNGSTAQPSGCLIAVAAFGSELTPQVQFLHDFRDPRILSTTAGSSFMNVFNSSYYSFSPSVADYEREQTGLQATVKTAIYPLLGILHLAEKGYDPADKEGGSVLAGFAASSLISMVYLLPAAVSIRNKANVRKLAVPLAIVLITSLGIIAAGAAAENSMLLMASTVLFMLSSMGIIAVMHIARIVQARLAKTTL